MKNKQLDKKYYQEFVENFWLNLGQTHEIKTRNIFAENEIFQENPVMGLVDILRQPKNFAYTCQILFDIKLHPYQVICLQMLWNHSFSIFIATRGGSKSFLLAIYALLLALFKPGSKIVITGTSFRQAKIIFTNCEQIWKNAPIFQDILYTQDRSNRPTHEMDMFQFRIGRSTIVALPTGDGTRIRGQRSSCLICDEFNTVDVKIYQEVMQGFGAVSLNPIEKVIESGKRQALLELGKISEQEYIELENSAENNQQILSGTPGYTFEHLYTYWKKYHNIIMSQGDPHKVSQIYGGPPPRGFNWKDYAVIRLPYNILPKGYMDEKIIGMAQATTSLGIFHSEYGSVFISDSLGFFRRTLIEKCTCGNALAPIDKKSCGPVSFNAVLRGQLGGKYVMGIDPAAESDSFAVTILEVWPDHRRLVYCWTVNKDKHKAQLRAGIAQEHDYYRFCCRKIRDLMKVFKIEYIGVDSQGGGVPIREILGDPKNIQYKEYPIYEIEEAGVTKDTDGLPGLHILHMIQFANAQWTHDANHGLRQDMETQELVFPIKDSLAFGLAHEEDKIHNRIKLGEEGFDTDSISDTLEDCMLEIEELKNELVLIEHSKTASGRDKWDTPQIKAAGSKKGRLRKDRYSSLVISNMIGRSLIARLAEPEYFIGGFAKDLAGKRVKNKETDMSVGFGVIRGSKHKMRY